MFADLWKNIQNLLGLGGPPTGAPKGGGYNAAEGVYYAKGTFTNATEYNNEIVCITNAINDMMSAMNDAMDAKDYQRAEQVRLSWLQNTHLHIEQLNKLGDYHGNAMLKNAAVKFLRGIDGVMNDGYKKLIEMRMAGKRGSDEEQEQLDENNDQIQELVGDFNEVSDEFLADN